MQDRKLYIDIIRICSCFCVVALHVTVIYMRDSLPVSSRYWWVSYIVNMFTRIAVPLFVVISGYLNLGRDIKYNFIIKKSFTKLILPLFLFGVVTIVYRNWLFNLNQDITFFFLIKKFISGPMMFHLGFLYILAALYLISPFLNYIVLNIKEDDVKYFFALLLTVSTIATIARCQNLEINRYIIKMNLVTGFISYYLAGGLLKEVKLKFGKITTLVIFSTMLAVNIIFTPYLSPTLENLRPVLFNQGSVTILIATLSFFAFIKNYFSAWVPTESFRNSIIKVSSLCFGVYLIHPMIMITVMSYFKTKHFFLKVFPFDMIITVMIVFSLSLLISSSLREIPLIKKML